MQKEIAKTQPINVSSIMVHPGEVLLEEFMKPLGLTQYSLAKRIGVTPMRISEIVREKRNVSADTAVKLSRYLETTPQFWLTLQMNYDLSKILANN